MNYQSRRRNAERDERRARRMERESAAGKLLFVAAD